MMMWASPESETETEEAAQAAVPAASSVTNLTGDISKAKSRPRRSETQGQPSLKRRKRVVAGP